jgi:hypothetical protein
VSDVFVVPPQFPPQFPIVGTAGAVAARHREAFQRISIPGQGEDVAGDQGSAKVLTFDLSISLLKRLNSGVRVSIDMSS